MAYRSPCGGLSLEIAFDPMERDRQEAAKRPCVLPRTDLGEKAVAEARARRKAAGRARDWLSAAARPDHDRACRIAEFVLAVNKTLAERIDSAYINAHRLDFQVRFRPMWSAGLALLQHAADFIGRLNATHVAWVLAACRTVADCYVCGLVRHTDTRSVSVAFLDVGYQTTEAGERTITIVHEEHDAASGTRYYGTIARIILSPPPPPPRRKRPHDLSVWNSGTAPLGAFELRFVEPFARDEYARRTRALVEKACESFVSPDVLSCILLKFVARDPDHQPATTRAVIP